MLKYSGTKQLTQQNQQEQNRLEVCRIHHQELVYVLSFCCLIRCRRRSQSRFLKFDMHSDKLLKYYTLRRLWLNEDCLTDFITSVTLSCGRGERLCSSVSRLKIFLDALQLRLFTKHPQYLPSRSRAVAREGRGFKSKHWYLTDEDLPGCEVSQLWVRHWARISISAAVTEALNGFGYLQRNSWQVMRIFVFTGLNILARNTINCLHWIICYTCCLTVAVSNPVYSHLLRRLTLLLISGLKKNAVAN